MSYFKRVETAAGKIKVSNSAEVKKLANEFTAFHNKAEKILHKALNEVLDQLNVGYATKLSMMLPGSKADFKNIKDTKLYPVEFGSAAKLVHMDSVSLNNKIFEYRDQLDSINLGYKIYPKDGKSCFIELFIQ